MITLTLVLIVGAVLWTKAGADFLDAYLRAAGVSVDPFGWRLRMVARELRCRGKEVPREKLRPVWRIFGPAEAVAVVIVCLFSGPRGWVAALGLAVAAGRNWIGSRRNLSLKSN